MAKNRSLRAVNMRLGAIDQMIAEIIEEKGCADVLEVGCGFGLPMHELKRRFRDKLTITGINRSADFNRPSEALWEGVRKLRFPPWAVYRFAERYGSPMYVNCDANAPLPFPEDSFDLVYSIASTGFFREKIRFLEEVNRVLRPRRRARIHFHYLVNEVAPLPNVPQPPQAILCEIVDGQGKQWDALDYLRRFSCVRVVERPATQAKYIELWKAHETLSLGLELVESVVLSEVDKRWSTFVRSVYREIPTAIGSEACDRKDRG